jgi:hypothetical protein
MPWPSNLDGDPNYARLALECVLRITSTAGNITNPTLPRITAAIQARTGVAPLSATIDSGAAVVVMPADRQLWDYIGNVMSAMAAANLPGSVTGFEQGRVT